MTGLQQLHEYTSRRLARRTHHFERIKWLTATHAQRRPSGRSLSPSLLFLRSNVSEKALANSIPAVQRQGKLESNPGESSNVVHLQTNELESFVFNAAAAAAAQKKFQVSLYEENERENREKISDDVLGRRIYSKAIRGGGL